MSAFFKNLIHLAPAVILVIAADKYLGVSNMIVAQLPSR